jgi:hypothetical protein
VSWLGRESAGLAVAERFALARLGVAVETGYGMVWEGLAVVVWQGVVGLGQDWLSCHGLLCRGKMRRRYRGMFR